MATKSKCQKRHAIARALERYDLRLTEHQYYYLCDIIKKHGSKILFKQSNRVTIHNIEWEGKDLVVVYDKVRSQIVSFLPNSYRFEDIEL